MRPATATPLLVAGLTFLLMPAVPVVAAGDSNTTQQIGRINVNRTYQIGNSNSNATYQSGTVNVNRTIQVSGDQLKRAGRAIQHRGARENASVAHLADRSGEAPRLVRSRSEADHGGR